MRSLNEALVLGSIRQHELTEAAQHLNTRLQLQIVERKRAEESVRTSEIRYRSLFEAAADGILLLEPDTGRITDANPFMTLLLDRPHEDMIGRKLFEIGLFKDEAASTKMFETLRLDHKVRLPELNCMSGLKQQKVIDFQASFYHEYNRPVVQCHIRDITEQKKLEQHSLRTQRLEEIGSLAAGIAHDMNNVLAPVMMSITLLRRHISDPKSLSLLELMDQSAHHGAEMVKQVLGFARGTKAQAMSVDASIVLRDLLRIVGNTFPKNIQVETNIGHDLWPIKVDPTQLQQVLLNLCVNSRDAMPDGGKITVCAENLLIDAPSAAMHLDAKAGPYLKIEVVDTGDGIAPEIIEKLFDPFFTTKEEGKGCGLGLSNSMSIIKSHGGFIQVHSDAGKGSRFAIHLPATQDPTPPPAKALAPKFSHGHGRMILVVDDEESIREITRQILETFDYKVLLASNGAEAICVFLEHQKEISAVITDILMPIMDGNACVRTLRGLDPDLRIIRASGDPPPENGTETKADHFLEKPYTAETLLNALDSVLLTR